MNVLGLGPGAQVIVLQALSAYTAILSAYFFARPVLRGQAVSFSKEILSSAKSDDPDVTKLLNTTIEILNNRIQVDQPSVRRSNNLGYALLVASLLLLTGAIAWQIETDPSFVRTSSADTTATKTPASK
jgi:hypothetical protein